GRGDQLGVALRVGRAGDEDRAAPPRPEHEQAPLTVDDPDPPLLARVPGVIRLEGAQGRPGPAPRVGQNHAAQGVPAPLEQLRGHARLLRGPPQGRPSNDLGLEVKVEAHPTEVMRTPTTTLRLTLSRRYLIIPRSPVT